MKNLSPPYLTPEVAAGELAFTNPGYDETSPCAAFQLPSFPQTAPWREIIAQPVDFVFNSARYAFQDIFLSEMNYFPSLFIVFAFFHCDVIDTTIFVSIKYDRK
jgi:hypothetical protein